MSDWKGRLISDWAPPALRRYYARFCKKNGYFGNYRSWSEARAASTGYDSAHILDKVSVSMLLVKQGRAVYERDSVLFDKVQHSWPLMTALIWIASRQGNRLNLMDLGGSLGSSYYQCRDFLDHLESVHWSVVEQGQFVARGKELFQDEVLKFYYSVEECMAERQPDTLLLSSVLPYLESPHQVLRQTLRHRPAYVVVDRTPFLEGGRDRLTVQVVPKEIYGGSYPAWILGEGAFLEQMQEEYQLVAEFDALGGEISLGDCTVRHKGFIFVRCNRSLSAGPVVSGSA